MALLETPSGGIPPVITSDEELAQAVANWRFEPESVPIAVDAERASGFRYFPRAYLVQLRYGQTTAVIDPVPIDDFTPLSEFMAEHEWILHSSTQDLPCLAELGLAPEQLFDTEVAARLLGLPRIGLGSLCEDLLGTTLAKGHAASDWSKRPLPKSWVNYAALDVELLADLRELLWERLDAAGRAEWAQQEFDFLCGFTVTEVDEPWRRTSGLHKVKSPRGQAIVRELWATRDQFAQARDTAPGRVLRDDAIVAAALESPASADELSRVAGWRKQRNRGAYFAAIQRAQAMSVDELPGKKQPAVPQPKSWSRKSPEAAFRLGGARYTIRAAASELGVDADVLLAPRLLRQLAWQPPAVVSAETISSMLTKMGARPWQQQIVVPLIEEGFAAGPPE